MILCLVICILGLCQVWGTSKYEPQIKSEDKISKLGENITLDCASQLGHQHDFFHKLSWKIQYPGQHSSALGNDSRVQITTVGNDTVRLEIANVSREDEAVYICQSRSEGDMIFHTKYELALKGDKVEFHNVSRDMDLLLDYKAQVECNADIVQDMQIQWVKYGMPDNPMLRPGKMNGTAVETEPGGRVLSSGSKLIFDPFTEKDEGWYRCVITQRQETVDYKNIFLKGHIMMPELLKDIETKIPVALNDSAVLNCTIHAWPKVIVEWVTGTDHPISIPRDDRHIKRTVEPTAEDPFLFGTIFHIKDVQKEDYRDYFCMTLDKHSISNYHTFKLVPVEPKSTLQ